MPITLIFDFGAVLLPINESLTWESFKKLGAKKTLQNQSEIFTKYEVGQLHSDAFLAEIQPHFYRKIYTGDLANAWNAMLISPIQDEIIAFLKKLRKKGHRLILLSNTNPLHIGQIKKASGPFAYKQFTKQFEQIYYSHEIGLRKPEEAIFEKVLKDNDLEAENCLYIDDKLENTESGAKVGLHTWHFNPEEDSILDLDKVLSERHL